VNVPGGKTTSVDIIVVILRHADGRALEVFKHHKSYKGGA
jgi:hypothetical protein